MRDKIILTIVVLVCLGTIGYRLYQVYEEVAQYEVKYEPVR